MRVEPRSEARERAASAQARVEVLDLDAGDQPDVIELRVLLVVDAVAVAALNRHPQMTLPAALTGDQQAFVDRPGDLAGAIPGLVAGGAETKQGDPPERRHRPVLVGVDDADDAEREAAQERPVAAGEQLEAVGGPDPLEHVAPDDDLGLLDGADGAAALHPDGVVGLEDLDPPAFGADGRADEPPVGEREQTGQRRRDQRRLEHPARHQDRLGSQNPSAPT
ncbi:MAG: hypothetical protein KDB46_12210 [Solirubrobacterales bacterium]|nr:hypothetical protein [Solirubrobacterales bacterium]